MLTKIDLIDVKELATHFLTCKRKPDNVTAPVQMIIKEEKYNAFRVITPLMAAKQHAF